MAFVTFIIYKFIDYRKRRMEITTVLDESNVIEENNNTINMTVTVLPTTTSQVSLLDDFLFIVFIDVNNCKFSENNILSRSSLSITESYHNEFLYVLVECEFKTKKSTRSNSYHLFVSVSTSGDSYSFRRFIDQSK